MIHTDYVSVFRFYVRFRQRQIYRKNVSVFTWCPPFTRALMLVRSMCKQALIYAQLNLERACLLI